MTQAKKVRTNVTIDEDLRDKLDAKGIIKNRKLSGIVNQLLHQYISYESINAMDSAQTDFISREIKKSIDPLRRQFMSLEEKIMPLLLITAYSSISKLSKTEFDELMDRIPMWMVEYNLGIDKEPTEMIEEFHKLINEIGKYAKADDTKFKSSNLDSSVEPNDSVELEQDEAINNPIVENSDNKDDEEFDYSDFFE